jgi:hypothetical protein
MEFKIGDRVKGWHGKGKVIEVDGDSIAVEHDKKMGGHDCRGKGNEGYCWWYLKGELTKIGGNMKKDELKYRDIVTLKNGDELVLFDNGELVDKDYEGHWIDSLDDYLDDLKCRDRCYSEYDIVKVERPVEYETVYKRDDVVELTVDEISEKLGYKVKVVGEDR